MNSNMYIARQPILDNDENIFAYELLYRDSNLTSEIKNDRKATVCVLNNALNVFGVKELLGEYKAFIKVDTQFLSHEVFFMIPNKHFIFALQPTMEFTPVLVEKIQKLHDAGYVFAINDMILDEKIYKNIKDILKFVSYLKIDIKTSKDNLELIKKYKIDRIFTKVETHDMYEKAKQNNSTYIQGYYFAKPKILKQEKFDSYGLNTIKLCNYIMSDKSIDEIVQEFEKNHAISVNLLKFINSGSFHFRNKISSVKQILTLMGRTPLLKWLMLMTYSFANVDNTLEKDSALMILVKSRTTLMVEVSKLIDKKLASKAYLVGIISLMDALFNIDMQKILIELNVNFEIKEALLSYEGILGEIYKFAIDIEAFNEKEIEKFVRKYKIDMKDIETLTFEVVKNSNSIKEI